jgi:hypothetical protein
VDQTLPEILNQMINFAETCADAYIEQYMFPKNSKPLGNLVVFYNIKNKEFHWTTSLTALGNNEIIFNQFNEDSFGHIGKDPVLVRYLIVDLIMVDLDWEGFKDKFALPHHILK